VIASLQDCRVLITGGSGFTGRHLAAAIRAVGGQVSALSNSPMEGDQSALWDGMFTADICDRKAVMAAVKTVDPTHIIHLAAISATRHEDVSIYETVNVQGSSNVLHAAKEAAPHLRQIVMASSAAVYGLPGEQPVSEDRPPAPENAYGRSKLEMEKLARESGLPILIFRPFNYTGPGQPDHFVVPKLVASFIQREPILELWETVSVREFGDVRDAVAAYLTLMAQGTEGTFNLCTGQGNSIQTVINTLKSITGHSPTIKRTGAPGKLLTLVGDRSKLSAAGAADPVYSLEDTLRSMLEDR
jgi:nucleoside-diphosphate-sugar epimerase